MLPSRYLAAEDGDGGGGVLAIKAELDETSEVVLNRPSARILATHTARGDVRARGTRGSGVVSGEHELDLTEGTAGRHNSLAHILQETSGHTVDRGEVRVLLGVVLGGSPGRRREGTLRERTTSASTRSERIDDALERGERHEKALLSVNLLDTSLERSHLVLYLLFRKYFRLPEKKQPELEGLLMETPPPYKQLPDFELPLTNYNLNGENGRVNLTVRQSAGGSAPSDFPGYQYQRTSEDEFQNDMLRGNWEPTEVTKSYFSKANVDLLQNAIRREVFNRSQPKGYVIDNQSVDELKMIMRAIYYTYSRNLPFDIQGQVNELNGRVIEWSVPHILSAVDHFYYYLNDISHLPVPLQQPQNLSRAGTRTKPFVSFM